MRLFPSPLVSLAQVIKEDVLRSLWARCDMHCDSLIGEEQRGQPDGTYARPLFLI